MKVAHVEFLVEDRSTATALNIIVPRIVPGLPTFTVRAFSGKTDVDKNLETRLRGLRNHMLRINGAAVVVLDRDAEDCKVVKQRIRQAATNAGWSTSDAPKYGSPTAMVRIAIEEVEAWFLGDIPAITAAYPKVNPKTHLSKSKLRAPDDIVGAWEELERILKKAGYHSGGLAKSVAARDIASHMNVETNDSPSFITFRDGVKALVRDEETA